MVRKAAGRMDEFTVTQALAATQQFSGQYNEATATIQRAFEQAGHAKAPDAQAGLILCQRGSPRAGGVVRWKRGRGKAGVGAG